MTERRGKPLPSQPCLCEEHKLELDPGQCHQCGHELPGGMIEEILQRTNSRVTASTARTALAIARIIAK